MAKSGWTNLDKAMRDLEKEVTDIARGITVHAWNSVLSKTPQFYGRMAASWTYSIGSPVFVDRSPEVPRSQPYSDFDDYDLFNGLWRGHATAIGIANSHSMGADKPFKLGDTVWIANGVDHGEGPYSAAIENGEIRLRKFNEPGAPVKHTIDQLTREFDAYSGRVRPWRQIVYDIKIAKIGGKRV